MRKLLLCFALLFASLGAQSQTLYGAVGAGNATSNLFSIDQATGTATPIGPLGQALTGMSLQTSTGIMYGVTNGNAACSRCLVTVDLVSGAATVVGPLGQIISETEFGSNGVLYGWAEGPDELASINLTTGAATVIPGSGISTAGDGMALVGGAMYVMPESDNGTYYTVNTATGAVTVAGTLGGVTGNQISAASTRLTDNAVYAVINTAVTSTLVTVNVATGALTNVGPSVFQLDALAFGPLAGGGGGPEPTPTLSQWAMFALALLLGFAGLLAARRRNS